MSERTPRPDPVPLRPVRRDPEPRSGEPLRADLAARTALAVALMRSLHARADPQPILDDPWGDRLMPAAARAQVFRPPGVDPDDPRPPFAAHPLDRQDAFDASLRANLAYATVIVRTRFTEDALHRAAARGVRQYVVIGAGFDSYALRRPPQASDLTVVEIDEPSVQALKLRCMADSATTAPAWVRYVAADLATRDLASVLRTPSVRGTAPAFFSRLGTTLYLSRRTALATLQAIAAVGAPGSELVFAYYDRRFVGAPRAAASGPMAAPPRGAAPAGAPSESAGFDPETLEVELQPLGYRVLEDGSDADLVRRYDPEGVNGLVPSGFSRIAQVRRVDAGTVA